MYTPAQVSDMLAIPPSTLRHYALVFAAHLSNQAGRHHRLYSERDVLVFVQIKELAKLNKSLEAIAKLINVPEVPDLEDQRNTLALIPAIGSAIENVETSVSSLRSNLAEQQAQIEQLSSDLAYMRDLLKYYSLPWYKKLFSKPPDSKPA